MKLFAFLMFILVSWAALGEETRWVDIEWDAIPEAKEYELELFQNDEGQEYSRGKFKTEVTRWSHAVPPGKYTLKIRSIDDRGVPGEWSQAIELKVKILSPLMLRPTRGEKLNDSLINFEWNPVSGATSYQLVIRDKSGQLLHNAIVLNHKENVYLKDLGDYSWAVFALADGDEAREEEEWSEKSFIKFERVGGELEAPIVKVSILDMITLSWEKISDAQLYEVDFLPPPGRGEKNRRFRVKDSRFLFPKERLKEGVTTITVKAISAGYQDSTKSLVKFIKKNDTVRTTDIITGKSLSFKKPLTQLFWRHQFFYSLSLARYNYSSDNHATDTHLKQSDLSGLGLNFDWMYQNNPEASLHKFETSFLRLTSGDEAGFQGRVAYNYIYPFVSETKIWAIGAGGSLLSLPSFFGDRQEDTVSAEQALSLGPELSVSMVDPLTADWHLHAHITYAYHPLLISTPEGEGEAFSWLRAQVRFLKYTSSRRAYYFGGEYQRWSQQFAEDVSSLNGWSAVVGLKQGW